MDDQFRVLPKKGGKVQSAKKEPIGFYVGQDPVKKPQPKKPKASFKSLKKLGGTVKAKTQTLACRLKKVKSKRTKNLGRQKFDVQVPQKKQILKDAQFHSAPTKKPQAEILRPVGRARVLVTKKSKKRSWPKISLKTKPSKEVVVMGVLFVLGVGMTTAGLVIKAHKAQQNSASHNVAQKDSKGSETKTAVLGAASNGTSSEPTFETLRPTTAPVQVSFDAERQIAVYKDSFAGAQISITQQPYPEQLKKTSNGIEALAKSLNGFVSVSQFSTSSKGLIYLANLKANRQTVIFGTGDLLVFINSDISLKEEQWVVYLESLK